MFFVDMPGIRLQKVIAQAGLASRRAAEEMIRQGRVKVNGVVVYELGTRVDPDRNEILVDGQPIAGSSEKVYLLFYKPKNCVTTLNDPQGRKTIMDFMADLTVRVFPVGRLDYDAEGLLVITNDGALGHRLQHPSFEVTKTYEVKIAGHPTEKALNELRWGIQLDEGRTAPAQVEMLRLLPHKAWIKIVMYQGWYRQIKRMCDAVGHPVLKIKRTRYGPLKVGRLTPGSYRILSRKEIQELFRTVQLDDNKRTG